MSKTKFEKEQSNNVCDYCVNKSKCEEHLVLCEHHSSFEGKDIVKSIVITADGNDALNC